jgi:asparagine synthase (glutamine-hydrolysing)
MSGGIDSSTVICFFKNFKNSDHEIFSFSAQYKGLDSKVLHLIDESKFQDEINKSRDVREIAFAGENESTLSELDFYLEVIGQPFFFPNLYLPNKAFRLASDKDIALMMNGNDGDSVISHGYEYYLELFFSFRWVKLLQRINSTALRNNQSRRFIFKRLVYDNISLNNFLNASSQKKHFEFMSSSNHSKAIEIQSLLANHYGVEERYPFYNKELIEYCLNISPKLKNKHGHSRYVLKKAIKGVVPEKIRNRTSKANLGHALCLSFLQKDYELINEQFSNPNPLIKNIINFNDLNKSWDDLKKNPRKHATRSSVPSKIFSFVVLNRWLGYKKQKYEKA